MTYHENGEGEMENLKKKKKEEDFKEKKER